MTPTTYDGTWTFYIDVPQPQADFVIWDGDLDRGKFDGTESDTDDPNTPNDVLPPWAVPDTTFEGVAIGTAPSTGAPPDDRDGTGNGIYFLRTPSVVYTLETPDGTIFSNDNPSGSQEWESFALSTDPFDPQTMDFSAASLPAGLYKVTLSGMDVSNLNAWRFNHRIVCLNPDGSPCIDVPRPLRIGDLVWYDTDSDGVTDYLSDPGNPNSAEIPGSDEYPLANVVVELLDSSGTVVATTTTSDGTGTDPIGYYEFEVDAGEWTTRVAASNFAPGGVLEGYLPRRWSMGPRATTLPDPTMRARRRWWMPTS